MKNIVILVQVIIGLTGIIDLYIHLPDVFICSVIHLCIVQFYFFKYFKLRNFKK